jgi:hypothetical protein
MNGTNTNAPPLAELFAALARHRRFLFVAYFSLFAGFCAMMSFKGISAFVDLLAKGFGVTAWSSDEDTVSFAGLVLFFIILGLQILFLWIWGRLRDERVTTSFPRVLLPFLLANALLSLTVLTMIMSASELAQLWGIAPSLFEISDETIQKYAGVLWAASVLVGCLLGYLLYRFIRRRSRCQVLWRLSLLSFVAALVDLTLALPTELAVRGHKEEVFLAELTGSLIATVFSVPLLFWALGSVIYLLDFRTAYEGDSVS